VVVVHGISIKYLDIMLMPFLFFLYACHLP